MVHYLTSVKMKKTVIDKLILSEQIVNILGGLYPIFMLIRLGLPSHMAGILFLSSTPFCVFTEMVMVFAFFHRAIAGCGIAGLRQGICLTVRRIMVPSAYWLNFHLSQRGFSTTK